MTLTNIAETLKYFWLTWVAPPLEFLLILLIVYALLYFFRRTRAISVLWGVIVILLGLGLVSNFLKLEVFQWILQNLWQLLALAMIVIFQPELRRAFAQLGSVLSPYSHARQLEQREAIEEIVNALTQMSVRRCGALIVFERRIGLAAITTNAVQLDAKINSLLLQSLFYPNSPLHDGAVIIQDGKIVAAHAILPLTQEAFFLSSGTRHRAALGITEETGYISYAYKGKLTFNVAEDKLTDFLRRKLLEQKTSSGSEKEDVKDHDSI